MKQPRITSIRTQSVTTSDIPVPDKKKAQPWT